jgi:hypothetical protein
VTFFLVCEMERCRSSYTFLFTGSNISKIRSGDAGNRRCNHLHTILEGVVRDSVTRLGIDSTEAFGA